MWSASVFKLLCYIPAICAGESCDIIALQLNLSGYHEKHVISIKTGYYFIPFLCHFLSRQYILRPASCSCNHDTFQGLCLYLARLSLLCGLNVFRESLFILLFEFSIFRCITFCGLVVFELGLRLCLCIVLIVFAPCFCLLICLDFLQNKVNNSYCGYFLWFC